jgi:diguanylate cyclase (GGDEF)-like protein
VGGGPSSRSEEYALACEVSAAITSSLVLEDVMATVARRIAEALDVWECDLYEYYPVSETMIATACWAREMTPEDVDWVGTRTDVKERRSYQDMFRDRRFCEAYAGDETDSADGALMDEWGEKATISFPLIFEGSPIGCLTLVEKRVVRRFDEADRRLIALLAAPAAVAIHNARVYRLWEEENRHLASLLDSSRALSSTLDLDDLLALVCRKAARALETAQCVIYEYDRRDDAIVYRALYEEAPTDDAGSRLGMSFRLDDYPSDRVVLNGGRIVEESILDPDLAEDVRASMEEWGEESCLSVPIAFNDEPVGMLVLIETERERRFSAKEIDLARGLAEQAAAAIHQARLYSRERSQKDRLLALLESSRVLAGSLDVSKVLDELRDGAAGLFGAQHVDADVTLVGDDGRCLPLAAVLAETADGGGDSDEPAPVMLLDDLSARVMKRGEPGQESSGDLCRVVVPLVLQGDAQGFVDVRLKGGHELEHDEMGLLQILASQTAAAIVNARLYRTIERQAITDGLTGLYNHRHFYERLNQEFARAQRYGLPLSLLMIDIDDFKQFNDLYGHPVGDLVLAEAGRILSEQLRKGVDLAARYGGEEFAVLLPNTRRDGAQVVGDRLVRQIAALTRAASGAAPEREEDARNVGERIRLRIGAAQVPGIGDGSEPHVSVSVGVAAFPGAAGGPSELVRNADKALYLAKRLGKNRVEVFDS